MEIIKNKKLLLSSIGVLLLVLLLLTVFFMIRTPAEVFNNNISFSGLSVNPPLPGGVLASYRYYENYDQADKYADTVVIGDVIEVDAPKELVTGKTVNTLTGEGEPVSHVYTVSEIKISKVIKGRYFPGDVVKIKQFGGAYKEIEYDERNMYGTVYYQTGERHIFFLESYEDSPCSTINPQQGDILIENGKIKASNKVQFIKDNISEELAEKALKERIEALKDRNNTESK
ncbi:hypothetical protein [Ruminiclostridium sufflavum]|nr:hypothetical protein [Ruminiclostridium sufflavum]